MHKTSFDIMVLGTNRKKILTTEYLREVKHQVYYNPDWDLPKGYKPHKKAEQIPCVLKYEPGPFRCFRGHQEALKLSQSDVVLMLEDDAVPNCEDWLQIIDKSVELLGKFDIVSLHNRRIKGIKNNFKHGDCEYVTLKPTRMNLKWALGSLAYLASKDAINKITSDIYRGYPMDIYLLNEFKMCILKDSCYDHDRKQGSLIDSCKKKRRKRKV